MYAMHFVTATLDMTISHEHALLYAMHVVTATPDMSNSKPRQLKDVTVGIVYDAPVNPPSCTFFKSTHIMIHQT